MDSRVPARIDRATFERVLQRAAEIQAASRDIGEGLSEEEILALGTEVGIPVENLRQALLEERTRPAPPAPATLTDRWFGRAECQAERVVQGTEESVGDAIAKWLEMQEHFVVQRAAIGRVTFEPMGGFAGALRKMGAMFDSSRSRPYLDKVELVTAVVTPLEAGFCHVTLGASLHRSRRGHIGGASAVVASGGMLGGFGILLGAPMLAGLIPLVLLGFVGTLIAGQFRRVAQRVQLGLERALDDLERRPPAQRIPPKAAGLPMRDIIQGVRKAFDP